MMKRLLKEIADPKMSKALIAYQGAGFNSEILSASYQNAVPFLNQLGCFLARIVINDNDNKMGAENLVTVMANNFTVTAKDNAMTIRQALRALIKHHLEKNKN